MQYMQILIAYLRIHANKYIQIPTDTYISIHTGGSKIPTAVTYLHDTGRSCIYIRYLQSTPLKYSYPP
jgi:hypothetical protein